VRAPARLSDKSGAEPRRRTSASAFRERKLLDWREVRAGGTRWRTGAMRRNGSVASPALPRWEPIGEGHVGSCVVVGLTVPWRHAVVSRTRHHRAPTGGTRSQGQGGPRKKWRVDPLKRLALLLTFFPADTQAISGCGDRGPRTGGSGLILTSARKAPTRAAGTSLPHPGRSAWGEPARE
jgi:hypothetical protein